MTSGISGFATLMRKRMPPGLRCARFGADLSEHDAGEIRFIRLHMPLAYHAFGGAAHGARLSRMPQMLLPRRTKDQTNETRIEEAKIQSAIAKIAGLRVLLEGFTSKAMVAELRSAEAAFLREATGGDFGVHNGTAD